MTTRDFSRLFLVAVIFACFFASSMVFAKDGYWGDGKMTSKVKIFSKSSVTAESQLKFGIDMAGRGLWREASFRFEQAVKLDSTNPSAWNNLAVSYEATGRFGSAHDAYQEALATVAKDGKKYKKESVAINRNYHRFVEFYQGFRPKQSAEAASVQSVLQEGSAS